MKVGVAQPFILVVLLFSQGVYAGDNFSKIHFFQVNYSGEENKTFSNDNPGAGLEISASTLYERFNWLAKARLTTISGTQDFLDAGTAKSSGFTFYQSSFEGGLTFYPLAKKKRGMNLYVGFTGMLDLNYLALDSTAFTELHPAYQAMSFGYSGVIGVEWFLSDRWCISTEFSQRYEKANLAKVSSFDLGGFSIAIGLGW